MAKGDGKQTAKTNGDNVLRQPAEILFAAELEALSKDDKGERPEGWALSPKAVETYILGGKAGDVWFLPAGTTHFTRNASRERVVARVVVLKK